MGSTKGITLLLKQSILGLRTSYSRFPVFAPVALLILPPIFADAFFWGISIMSWSNLGLEISLLPTTKDNLSTVNVATSWSGEQKHASSKPWLLEITTHCDCGTQDTWSMRLLVECAKRLTKMLAFLDWSLLHSAAPSEFLHSEQRLLPRETRFRQALGGQDHSQSSVQG